VEKKKAVRQAAILQKQHAASLSLAQEEARSLIKDKDKVIEVSYYSTHRFMSAAFNLTLSVKTKATT
jgi:hypothetical protein